MGYDVFISHSSKDKRVAHAVCAILEQSGIRCWIAPRDIVPGTPWASSILAGINQCRLMVLVFSTHANQSGHVRREVERAVFHGITVVPIRIEDVMPAGDLEYFLSSAHWMDALTPPFEQHLRTLAKGIRMILPMDGKGTAPVPAPVAEEEAKPPGPRVKIRRSHWAARMLVLLLLAVLGAGAAYSFRDGLRRWAAQVINSSATTPSAPPVETTEPPAPHPAASTRPDSFDEEMKARAAARIASTSPVIIVDPDEELRKWSNAIVPPATSSRALRDAWAGWRTELVAGLSDPDPAVKKKLDALREAVDALDADLATPADLKPPAADSAGAKREELLRAAIASIAGRPGGPPVDASARQAARDQWARWLKQQADQQRVAELLASAHAKEAAGDGQAALALLADLARIDPAHAEAKQLAADINARLAREADPAYKQKKLQEEGATVVAALKTKSAQGGRYDAALHERLGEALSRLTLADAQGRELLDAAKDYADGKLREGPFVAYLNQALETPEHRLERLTQAAAARAEAQRKLDVAACLAAAKANDSKESGQTALAALDELLVLDPLNAEALKLKDKISAYYRPAPTLNPAPQARASNTTPNVNPGDNRGTVKVGVLFSLSGTMAVSETSLRDVVLMAVEEINAKGGVLGKKLEPVVVDPASNWPLFAEKAKQLIVQDKVAVTFGCWTSVSRKSCLPVFEAKYTHDENPYGGGLLFFPVQYEGEEQSPNIFYTGPPPNQQLIPAADYMMSRDGGSKKKFYLLGTDFVFPRTANKVLKAYLRTLGVPDDNIAEEYTPFGHSDYQTIVGKIREFAKDGDACVLSTINGDSNVPFYKEFANQGITADKCPIVAFSVGEDELRSMETEKLVGHLAACTYFQSIDTPENKKFVENFKKYCASHALPGGENRVTDDPIEAAYFGVYVWKAAVEKAGTYDIDKVIPSVLGLEFNSPGGKKKIDEHSHHTWKPLFIGSTRADGQFDIIWQTPAPVKPDSFSSYLHSPEELERLKGN